MKKLLIACIALCLGLQYVSAQTPTFFGKDKVLGLGVGFGSNIYSGFGGDARRTPVFSLQFESCIKDNLFDDKSSIGIGGFIGYTSASNEFSAYNGLKYGWKSNSFIIGARGVFHYALVDKLDTYTGIMLSYNTRSWKGTGDWQSEDISDFDGGYPAFTGFVGARYYFTPKFAAFGEVGYGVSLLNVGVAYKL